MKIRTVCELVEIAGNAELVLLRCAWNIVAGFVESPEARRSGRIRAARKHVASASEPVRYAAW